MLERFYHKGATFLTKLLIGEGRPPRLRPAPEMRAQLERYRLRSPALLWDGKTPIEDILGLFAPDAEGALPIYVLSLEAAHDPACSPAPRLLGKGTVPEGADGWIVASANPLDQASLAGFLARAGAADRIILNLTLFPDTTSYYSYIDYLGGDHRTWIHIHNPMRRCYGYPFPIALRATLRDASGTVLDATQIVLEPDCAATLTEESFRARPERGYVEIEFELNRKVNPFLHYIADYANGAHLLSNHQSGLGLHPARSRFTRGHLPADPADDLEVCLFQRDYAVPPRIRALLRHREGGEETVLETPIRDLARGEIRWVSVRALFPRAELARPGEAILEIESEVPLHRPNYYYRSGATGRYHDVSHAGADLRMQVQSVYGGRPAFTGAEKKAFRERGLEPFDLRFFVLPDSFGADCCAGIGNDTTVPLARFSARAFSPDGRLRGAFPVDFPVPGGFVDLQALLRANAPLPEGGVISLIPAVPDDPVPIVMNGIAGFRRAGGGPLTTTAAAGSQPDNLPFYFRGGPPAYTGRPATHGVTEIFARGILSDEFDTLYMLSYPAAAGSRAPAALAEIQILARSGARHCRQAEIPPNGCVFLRLSEAVADFPPARGEEFFTVWFLASGAHLYGQQLLIRKSDGSISLEHCYVGKFGY